VTEKRRQCLIFRALRHHELANLPAKFFPRRLRLVDAFPRGEHDASHFRRPLDEQVVPRHQCQVVALDLS
jgi:hypothetical protein